MTILHKLRMICEAALSNEHLAGLLNRHYQSCWCIRSQLKAN